MGGSVVGGGSVVVGGVVVGGSDVGGFVVVGGVVVDPPPSSLGSVGVDPPVPTEEESLIDSGDCAEKPPEQLVKSTMIDKRLIIKISFFNRRTSMSPPAANRKLSQDLSDWLIETSFLRMS